MKVYRPILFLLFATSTLFAQDIPDNFRLQKVIQANDLIVDNLNAILVTQDLKHLIISYDHQPTLLRVYETKKWERVNEIEISGRLYLGQSHMDCDNHELLYGDYGNVNPKFYRINILSDYKTRIKNKEVPNKTCGYVFTGKTEFREQQFRVKNTFIFVLNYPKRTIKVFTKKIKRT